MTTNLVITRSDEWPSDELFASQWDDLLVHSSDPSIFLTLEWMRAWWSAYSKDKQLCLWLCRDEKGTLLGAAPLYVSEVSSRFGIALRVARIVGDGTFDSENLSWPVRRGQEQEAIRALLNRMRDSKGEFDLLEINAVPEEAHYLEDLRNGLAAAGWYATEHEAPHRYVRLPDTWDAYLASLSGQMRSLIRRRTKSLEKSHRVGLKRCETPDALESGLDTLFRLHQERWEPRAGRGSFDWAQRRAFYCDMGSRLLRRKWLDLTFLMLDDAPVAVEFGFRYGDRHCYLQGGFASEHAAKSIGLVLKSYILQDLIANGVRYYDFLGGGEDYKLRWGSVAATYKNLSCAIRGTRGARHLRLQQAGERGKEWFREHAPAGLFRRVRSAYRFVIGQRTPAAPDASTGSSDERAEDE